MEIRKFKKDDRKQVIALWKAVFPDNPPHNEPDKVIDAKIAIDDLIFVAVEKGKILGTVMVGYDGHRGWLYSIAVDPKLRRSGIGRSLVNCAVDALTKLGCVKVNLQVRSTNSQVLAFYNAIGFAMEQRISLGKLLIQTENS